MTTPRTIWIVTENVDGDMFTCAYASKEAAQAHVAQFNTIYGDAGECIIAEVEVI